MVVTEVIVFDVVEMLVVLEVEEVVVAVSELVTDDVELVLVLDPTSIMG